MKKGGNGQRGWGLPEDLGLVWGKKGGKWAKKGGEMGKKGGKGQKKVEN